MHRIMLFDFHYGQQTVYSYRHRLVYLYISLIVQVPIMPAHHLERSTSPHLLQFLQDIRNTPIL
jgi:hypothetical protein